MAIADTGYVSNVREQLLARRVRLEDMLTRNQNPQFSHLLHEVDQALERVEGGSFGVLAEVCPGTVESERLLADPLARVCLECLSPQQQRALEFDLELAAQVQNGLLPPANLSLPGGMSSSLPSGRRRQRRLLRPDERRQGWAELHPG